MDEAQRAGLEAKSAVAATSLAGTARDQHGVLAKISHVAALAAERLQAGQGDASSVTDVLTMLREIQNEGHLGYLRQHGTDVDYQKIGTKVRGRFQTPGGRWRKILAG